MTNQYKLISTHTIPVRWVDMDAYGIVNNAKFLDYISETRIASFGKHFTESELHFVVAETHCLYKKSFTYPGTVLVEQYLKELGRTYMLFYYVLYLAGDVTKTIYAECTMKIVCLDPKTNKITRLPENFNNHLKMT